MTKILHFELDVPAEVALAGPGITIEGRYGNRVMYTLADNRVMYVAPIVASRISKLEIQPGELFQVCKQEKREGQRKLIQWQVQRLPSDPETQTGTRTPRIDRTRTSCQGRPANRSKRGTDATASTPSPATGECRAANLHSDSGSGPYGERREQRYRPHGDSKRERPTRLHDGSRACSQDADFGGRRFSR
jgi:hypothetical protein